MAGLAEMLLGKENPFAQWTSSNQNYLGALAAGIGSGQNIQSGLSNGLQMVPQAKQMDVEFRRQQEADAKVLAQTNATQAWLQQNHPDLAQMVEAGMPVGEAWNMATERMKPQGAAKPIEVNGQLIDPNTFEVLGDFRTPETNSPSLPTSYQEFLLSQENPAYGASLNSSTSRPPTEGQRRNQQLSTVVEPQAEIVLQNWDELTNAGNQSIGFNTIAGAPGFALTSPGYQQATNALKTIAQSYLYSVSGAAATDSETQKIIDSVTPKFGESEQSASDKKKLILRMVESIKAAGGGAASPMGGTPGGVDPVAAADALLQSGKY